MIGDMPVIPSTETFDRTWSFRLRFSEASDFPMHYIDEGAGPETLLLLHGEPTWSYLFRHQIPIWAERHRVIAIWGAADRTLQAQHFLPLFRQAFPEGEVIQLPGVGHYSPEDAPLDIARTVSVFVDASADLLIASRHSPTAIAASPQ